MLSEEQVESIRDAIKARGYEVPSLIEELTDHACEAIESEMAFGVSFEEARQHTLENLNEEEPHRLQSNIIRILLKNREIKALEWNYSALMSVALVLWILIEYLAKEITGIQDLGPLYGSVSMLVIVSVFWVFFRRTARILDTPLPSTYIMKSGIKLAFFCSLYVLLFLTFFWTFIDTHFYIGYQFHPDELTPGTTLYRSSLAGMFLGIMGEAFVISLLMAFTESVRKKYILIKE